MERMTYTPMGRRWYGSSTLSTNRYRYNGKEEQELAAGLPYTDYGARFFDPEHCTWLSPDPLSGKYPGVYPYAFCAGDPVNYVDPDGEKVKIWYKENNSMKAFVYSGKETILPNNQYVISVIDAYNYNKANWQRSYGSDSPLTNLVEREESINIMDSGDYDDYFSMSHETIYWNPKHGMLSNGIVTSPATGLAHEADHAVFYLDNNKSSPLSKIPDARYKTAEEKRVITGSEQKTARANREISNNQVTRLSHEGIHVIVNGVTSTTINRLLTDEFKSRQRTIELYRYSSD